MLHSLPYRNFINTVTHISGNIIVHCRGKQPSWRTLERLLCECCRHRDQRRYRTGRDRQYAFFNGAMSSLEAGINIMIQYDLKQLNPNEPI